MNEPRLEQLIEAYHDDTLSEDECREMMEWFDGDKLHLSAFTDELRISNALTALHLSESDEIPSAVKDSLCRAETATDISRSVRRQIECRALRTAITGRETMPPVRTRKRMWIVTAAVAAAIALLVYLPTLFDTDFGDTVATIRNARDAQGVSAGDELIAGQILNPANGRLKINFLSGAKLALEGPAELEILGPNSARLFGGLATVRVPGKIKGFVLVTPHERVTDLGTSFGVDVDHIKGTSISVFEGEIELGDRRRFTRGRTVTVEATDQSPREMPYDIDQFLDTWQVSFGVEELVGDVRVATPTERHAPGQATDNDSLLLFPEREGVVVSQGYRVDASEPGTYRRPFRRRIVQLAEDARVDSFLLQYNPNRDEDITKTQQFQGELHFDRPIVALILQKDLLDDSDRLLALPEIDFRNIFRRGINESDVVTLSADRRVLKIAVDIKNGVDQIRVLVASDNNPVSQ